MINASDIVEVAVYPPLGIARVGNADGNFIRAAEVVGAVPEASLRDADGRLKRQAVLFRIYARLASGAFRELTLDDGVEIEWRVSIANLKAGWYEFNNAMDLPRDIALDASRRNQSEVPDGRHRLDITPPPRTITGRGREGPEYGFQGSFFGSKVYLGEVRTDGSGRLIFLGGRGRSAPRWPGTKPTTFANNALWHDDVCDGSVLARVTVGDRKFEALPGYVAVAPPNYAPGLFGVVTMDDVVRETFRTEGWLPTPETTYLTSDVWPTLSRLSSLQWVNHGLFMAHGFGSPIDAGADAVIARMNDPTPGNRAWRETVFALFRNPFASGQLERLKLPYIYGDTFGEADDDALGLLPVTSTMYLHLQRWARGEFVADWAGVPAVPRFDQLSPEQQVEHLSRAPLHECLGGPFHPGIELTWIMRRASLWAGPYRLRVLEDQDVARQDFGPVLTPEACLDSSGPLRGVAPGSLTRWLGVPWQTDEASCQSDFEYSPSTYLSMPSYWGARVPNQVLSAEAWSRATDDKSPSVQRFKHLSHREDWTRDINGRDYYQRIATMVDEWWMLGIVEQRQTPEGLRSLGLPAVAHVETGRHPTNAGSNHKVKLVEAIERMHLPADTGGGADGPVPAIPPRRRFHRGEV